jgi:catechol 2,3-dioxygenase-like lactoylglutathione lyase family enzyme
MSTTATEAAVRFHIGLHVSDLNRAVHFYRLLLGAAPAKHLADYARFESDSPPLVLALIPNPQPPGGALNHLGLRLPDSGALVEVQRRLEEAGIATQRQEGVECCYARQTKFWVTDPDHNLIEIYVFEEDLDHSGFDDPPSPLPPAAAPAAVWQHHLLAPLPDRIELTDGAADEVRLEGTLNAPLDDARQNRFLAEVRRVLRPGGKLVVHALVADRTFPGVPSLPGLASVVRHVPVEGEVLEALRRAGFTDFTYERRAAIHCFGVGGVELCELRLGAWRAPDGAPGRTRAVLYKGPLDRVTGEDGITYVRGERMAVNLAQWEMLRQGPAAGQFLFFGDENLCS